MNMLAIDAASSVLSIAVAHGEEIFYAETDAQMKHSELVMNYIDSLTAEAGLKPHSLDGVLCMGGPGSFTGLRIGYSIAKALSLSLSIPFAPVPTLDCIALPYSGPSLVIPVIQARKNAWFYSLFRCTERLLPDADADASQISETIDKKTDKNEKIILTGPGAALLYGAMPQELKRRLDTGFENRGYAKELISIAKNRDIFHNDNTACLYSGPEYIRKTDAELNLPGSAGN
jgi:tRNA threonylcarbamoyladenosine biosynthesis protein TsaB